MIYKDGIWVRERICDLTADKQNEIKSEVTEAYEFFGYKGQKLEDAVNTIMDAELVDAANLLGTYKWALANERR